MWRRALHRKRKPSLRYIHREPVKPVMQDCLMGLLPTYMYVHVHAIILCVYMYMYGLVSRELCLDTCMYMYMHMYIVYRILFS